ncbi:hypothetical protein AAH991_32710 [Microbispora sp. ZYX-F-249]|uniref:NAD-dependent epimerase/dehydratase family protein n=1 Tax=Microbispora maris TaxID=3144104 RepID=A0ABV0B0N9_9ACTN
MGRDAAMLVSVTGGTGFAGGHPVAAIAAAGHRTRAPVRGRGRLPDRQAGPVRPLNAEACTATVGEERT